MSPRAPASLRIEHLTHRYPGAARAALDDVACAIAAGQRVGLLGPNGAGKSTLMRILCGFLPVRWPAAQVEVGGLDVRTESLAVRRATGYMPELVPLYPELRCREQLRFRAQIKGLPTARVAAEIDRVAAATGLTDVLATPVGKLSRGYRQRVGIADALLGSPPLLVLDEPTVGLDPNQIREIRAMLRELGGAQTLVFSSHILAEVESLCDRVVILAHGRVVLDAAMDEALAANELHVELACDRARAEAIVAAACDAVGHAVATPTLVPVPAGEGGTALRIELAADDDRTVVALRHAVGAASLAAAVAVRALVPGRTRLEARFAEVTGGQRA